MTWWQKDLAKRVCSERDTKTPHVFEENLKNASSLFVNETRDTFDTTTTSQTTNGGFGNALNVVAKDLAVTLSSASANRYCQYLCLVTMAM